MRDRNNKPRQCTVQAPASRAATMPQGNLRSRRDSEVYMTHPLPASSVPNALQRMLSALWRFALVVGGMLLMLAALMLALVLASGVLLWALLRGRRPEPVNLRWNTVPRRSGFGRRASGEVVEVVDVQVREVREAQAREVDGPPPR